MAKMWEEIFVQPEVLRRCGETNKNIISQIVKVLKPYINRGDIKVVEEEWVEDWNPSVAREIVERALSANRDNIKAVVASNDGTAGGAIKALIEYRLAGKVAVSGQDADLAGCQRIVEGSQNMAVYVPIKDEAEGAAMVAVKLAKGESLKYYMIRNFTV